MAIILQTPTIIPFPPFDPVNDFTFEFLYSGNQPAKNRLVIMDNETSDIVYDTTISTMKLEHTVVANTLSAGKQYIAQIQVFDADNNYSNFSAQTLFYCFTTPSFCFSNLTDNEIYKSSSIELSVSYSQPERENIRSIQFLQYSYDKSLLAQSNTLYAISPYTFYGLENKAAYYFRCIGETINGMFIDTGYVKANIEYITAKANLSFAIENIYREGYIQLVANIKDIDYEFIGDGSHEVKDGLLVLKNEILSYNDGFEVPEDFILFVEAKKLPVATFLKTNDDYMSLSIVNICDSYYCKLSIKDSDYALFSPLPKAKISTTSGDILTTSKGEMIEIVNTSYDDSELIIFEVKRVGNLFNLSAYYRSELEATN